MSAVTQWFDGDVRPVHVGLYQRQYHDPVCDAVPDFWDGDSWWICCQDSEIIGKATTLRSWRGLAERSKP